MGTKRSVTPEGAHATVLPAVVWFTGLSGAGKSTIARQVYHGVLATGARAEYLDGDAIRALFPNTGFTRAQRDEHVQRVGFLASRLEHHGIFVICALISPYRESRVQVRSLCRRFVEVYVSTPLEVCEARDPKGLYARARRGELAHFTGLDDPYDPPANPELTIDTGRSNASDAAQHVLTQLGFCSDRCVTHVSTAPALDLLRTDRHADESTAHVV